MAFLRALAAETRPPAAHNIQGCFVVFSSSSSTFFGSFSASPLPLIPCLPRLISSVTCFLFLLRINFTMCEFKVFRQWKRIGAKRWRADEEWNSHPLLCHPGKLLLSRDYSAFQKVWKKGWNGIESPLLSLFKKFNLPVVPKSKNNIIKKRQEL